MLQKLFVTAGLIVIGEALWLGHDVLRTYINLRWGEPIKTAEKQSILGESIKRGQESEIHIGRHVSVNTTLPYFPVAADALKVRIWDGVARTNGDWLKYAMRRDPNLFTLNSKRILAAGATFCPFYHWFGGEPSLDREDGSPTTPKETRVAVVTSPGGHEYVIGALGQQFIFVPFADYKNAGLPTNE